MVVVDKLPRIDTEATGGWGDRTNCEGDEAVGYDGTIGGEGNTTGGIGGAIGESVGTIDGSGATGGGDGTTGE